MVTLRAYTFLDSLQPQLASHICTTCKGYFPTPEVASLFVEIAPGLQIHALLETALKTTRAFPASIVVERAFGMLELHHEDKGEVMQGGQPSRPRHYRGRPNYPANRPTPFCGAWSPCMP